MPMFAGQSEWSELLQIQLQPKTQEKIYNGQLDLLIVKKYVQNKYAVYCNMTLI